MIAVRRERPKCSQANQSLHQSGYTRCQKNNKNATTALFRSTSQHSSSVTGGNHHHLFLLPSFKNENSFTNSTTTSQHLHQTSGNDQLRLQENPSKSQEEDEEEEEKISRLSTSQNLNISSAADRGKSHPYTTVRYSRPLLLRAFAGQTKIQKQLEDSVQEGNKREEGGNLSQLNEVRTVAGHLSGYSKNIGSMKNVFQLGKRSSIVPPTPPSLHTSAISSVSNEKQLEGGLSEATAAGLNAFEGTSSVNSKTNAFFQRTYIGSLNGGRSNHRQFRKLDFPQTIPQAVGGCFGTNSGGAISNSGLKDRSCVSYITFIPSTMSSSLAQSTVSSSSKGFAKTVPLLQKQDQAAAVVTAVKSQLEKKAVQQERDKYVGLSQILKQQARTMIDDVAGTAKQMMKTCCTTATAAVKRTECSGDRQKQQQLSQWRSIQERQLTTQEETLERYKGRWENDTTLHNNSKVATAATVEQSSIFMEVLRNQPEEYSDGEEEKEGKENSEEWNLSVQPWSRRGSELDISLF